ncbi:MAG: bifunctional salicylyl-CoA 5-hydroxylase/oxidoreductase [Candidatus Eisenbacteria bacterium]|uniref:Bifunctional salicylyl-CoA 5-hydroxylase/oxidoreductase n=1 Tax=Eiseniibacteriota bacterium TaxID=2212470 RepID=A0A538T5J0_UNCEI|nr:MAG: bifunctional salicylyl-CoA 5-hydroxylase/oxidoreductase [Candidatus Eisenbacteria bacterium]
MGGGPAGLFAALLLKKADPKREIAVYERNRLDETFGFGVVFSDATEQALGQADPEISSAMASMSHRWDDIEIHYADARLTSGGHAFSGLSRKALLKILADRCLQLGVKLCFQREIGDPETLRDADLVLAADGANSIVRERYREHFRPAADTRPNRFVWLGTKKPFPAFTFYFKADRHGLWRVHAYQYEPGFSTFIVEARDTTWRAAGMDRASEGETIAFCERLFAKELDGHRLVSNRSVWRSFPTIRNERWHHENVVLLGDAAHTAHFSVGSGTKLAMEDAVALAGALEMRREIPASLEAYEEARRPAVESLQRAAQASLQWFEDTERYMKLDPLQFAFTLLTRSLRVTHENLKTRDPAFVAKVDGWYAAIAAREARVPVGTNPPPPPMFTPFRLRDLVLENRVAVSPMCQYSAADGTPDDWHLVHLGSRAMGGAGLVFCEMTNVSAGGRISPGCTGMYKPEHALAWKRIVDFVHRHTRARIAIQLGHAGRKASTRKSWEGDNEPLPSGNWPVLAPSAIPYFPHSQVPKEMTRGDMDAVIADYVRAAGLAVEAGFDMLEIHAAHGYLLASFISPITNRRADDYGGSLPNRMRFPLEVFDAVRAAWPKERPMSVRISAVDWYPGGMEPSDSVEVARMLQEHGCDIVDVSAGQTVPDQRPVYGRLFQTPFADRIRHEVGIATMAVGNISSYADVNTILAAGRADLCLLARAHLWDPYWTRHAAHELGYTLPWPDPYESLNNYKPRFT